MSIVGTKWNSKSRTVNGEWETVVTVHETFEKRDGSTEIKTREIKMEGHPDKATMVRYLFNWLDYSKLTIACLILIFL